MAILGKLSRSDDQSLLVYYQDTRERDVDQFLRILLTRRIRGVPYVHRVTKIPQTHTRFRSSSRILSIRQICEKYIRRNALPCDSSQVDRKMDLGKSDSTNVSASERNNERLTSDRIIFPNIFLPLHSVRARTHTHAHYISPSLSLFIPPSLCFCQKNGANCRISEY